MGKLYTADQLVVGVTYYQNRCNSVVKCCNEYELIMDNYIKQLKDLKEDGISSGQTADVFSEFIIEVEKARNIIKDIGLDYSKKVNSFLNDIDIADDKLFKNKGRKILTKKEFDNARAVAKVEFSLETLFNGTWLMNLFWTGSVAQELKDESSKMMKRVQELNEYSRNEISKIEANCRKVDTKYSRQLCNINKELRNYNQIIKKISEIVSPEKNNFNKKNIADLKKYIKKAEKFRKEVVKDPECNSISDDDVKYFSDNVINYFGKSTDAILGICQDSMGNLFLTDFEKYRTTVNEAKEYFNSYSKDYTRSKKKFDEAKKRVDELFDLYKKYGDNWKEYCPNKENAELFDKIIKKFGGASKKIDKYKDIWYQLFFDMSESKEVLDRYKANCDMSNENVRKAIERLEQLYDKNIDAYLMESFEEYRRSVEKMGEQAAVDAVVDFLKDKNLIFGMMCEKIFEHAFAEIPAVAEYEWVESTSKTLNNAVTKLKNLSPSSEEYLDAIKAVREAFDAAKKAQIKFFKKMLSNAKIETDKNYYQYCIDTINSASLDDMTSLDIMYKTQFNNQNYNPLTDLTD